MTPIRFWHMDQKIPGTNLLLTTEQCQRISSDLAPRNMRATHLLRTKDKPRRFVLMTCHGREPSVNDRLEIVAEGAAFETFMEHMTEGGQLFLGIADVFSKEQVARIVEM